MLVREHLRKEIEVCAQNVFDKPNGAFTGEISVSQLKDSNITWTLLGHSERRTLLGEDDAVGRHAANGCKVVYNKADLAWDDSLLRTRLRLHLMGD